MGAQGLLDLDLGDGSTCPTPTTAPEPAAGEHGYVDDHGHDRLSSPGGCHGHPGSAEPAGATDRGVGHGPRGAQPGPPRVQTRPGGGTSPPLSPVAVAGRHLAPSPVFDTYWRFAARRQAVYEARVAGLEGPWTDDPILTAHRFTNCFRAADRVSQFLISEVLYRDDQSPDEVVFRALLFKLFNKIETWHRLRDAVGTPSWARYDFESYDRVLGSALDRRQTLYSAAYVMPPPRLGEQRKHQNHLRLIELMMRDDLAGKVASAGSLRSVYEQLLSYPALGPFLAFQLTIDLNYSPIVNFPEADFVVAGPGARDGIRKCFGPGSRGAEEDIIHYMADSQSEHFERLGLEFSGLAGRRPLQPIDCQNLFCEVDKYSRAAHPEISGISGRTRIKQRYRYDDAPLTAWFPPKWGLNGPHPNGLRWALTPGRPTTG